MSRGPTGSQDPGRPAPPRPSKSHSKAPRKKHQTPFLLPDALTAPPRPPPHPISFAVWRLSLCPVPLGQPLPAPEQFPLHRPPPRGSTPGPARPTPRRFPAWRAAATGTPGRAGPAALRARGDEAAPVTRPRAGSGSTKRRAEAAGRLGVRPRRGRAARGARGWGGRRRGRRPNGARRAEPGGRGRLQKAAWIAAPPAGPRPAPTPRLRAGPAARASRDPGAGTAASSFLTAGGDPGSEAQKLPPYRGEREQRAPAGPGPGRHSGPFPGRSSPPSGRAESTARGPLAHRPRAANWGLAPMTPAFPSGPGLWAAAPAGPRHQPAPRRAPFHN